MSDDRLMDKADLIAAEHYLKQANHWREMARMALQRVTDRRSKSA